MGWQNVPPMSIQDAQKRGDSVYEVLYTDWGMNIADSWPPNPGPFMPLSIAGAAIGPRSTVDRAWLTYNLQQLFTGNALIALNGQGPITSRIRQLSVDTPLLFSQAAALGAQSVVPPNFGEYNEARTMLEEGALAFWPFGVQVAGPSNSVVGTRDLYPSQSVSTSLTTFFDPTTSTYIALNNGTLAGGGIQRTLPPPDLGTLDGSGQQGNWVGPALHLLLYLKPFAAQPPAKRAPLKTSWQWIAPGLVNGTEVCLAAIATFGRKTVHIMMAADQQCDFRVAALRCFSDNRIFVGFHIKTVAIEEPVDSITGVAANTPVVLNPCTQSGFYADYTLLYVTPRGGGGNTQLTYVLSAYD